MTKVDLQECHAALGELVALHNHPGAPCEQAFARRKRQAWARARRALGLPEEGTTPRNVVTLQQAAKAFQETTLETQSKGLRSVSLNDFVAQVTPRRNSEDIHD